MKGLGEMPALTRMVGRYYALIRRERRFWSEQQDHWPQDCLPDWMAT